MQVSWKFMSRLQILPNSGRGREKLISFHRKISRLGTINQVTLWGLSSKISNARKKPRKSTHSNSKDPWVLQTSLVVRAQPLSTLPLPKLAIILLPTTKKEICFPKIFQTNGGPQSLSFANLWGSIKSLTYYKKKEFQDAASLYSTNYINSNYTFFLQAIVINHDILSLFFKNT